MRRILSPLSTPYSHPISTDGYLATDARTPYALDYARSKGAVLITDLLLPPQNNNAKPGHPLTELPLRRLEWLAPAVHRRAQYSGTERHGARGAVLGAVAE